MSERRAIFGLLCQTLGELFVLPVHLVWFVVRRRAIRREIRATLEHARDASRADHPAPRGGA